MHAHTPMQVCVRVGKRGQAWASAWASVGVGKRGHRQAWASVCMGKRGQKHAHGRKPKERPGALCCACETPLMGPSLGHSSSWCEPEEGWPVEGWPGKFGSVPQIFRGGVFDSV